MLNSRLLIVGLFAVVGTWFPGNLAADEPSRRLPDAYTLDLFETFPIPGNVAMHADPRQPKLPLYLYGSDKPAYGSRAIWEPNFLDKFGAAGAVPVQCLADVAGLRHTSHKPCGDYCPLCQGPLPPASDAVDFVPEEPAEINLREGEPAKVLLQTMKQVRPSILDGTIFQESRPISDSEAMPLEGDGSQAIMVRCIRNLEAQAERQRVAEGTACLSSSTTPIAPSTPVVSPEAAPDAVAALRQAGRNIEETANMLEERGLYEQADQLRAVAQEMRIQARATAASNHPPVSYAPTPMPGPGRDGDELAGDKDLDAHAPKLRYDGDCEDQD